MDSIPKTRLEGDQEFSRAAFTPRVWRIPFHLLDFALIRDLFFFFAKPMRFVMCVWIYGTFLFRWTIFSGLLQVDQLCLLGTKPQIWGQSVGNSFPAAAASSRSGSGNRALTWIHWNTGEMGDELQRNVLVPALFLSPGWLNPEAFPGFLGSSQTRDSVPKLGSSCTSSLASGWKICRRKITWKENRWIYPEALLPPFGSTQKTPPSQIPTPKSLVCFVS